MTHAALQTVLDEHTVAFPSYERARFVTAEQRPARVPDWKRTDWACDMLPADDPARQGS